MRKNITAAIDFGNQSCILSIPSEHGVDIVLNESSNRKTPTIVGYQEGRRTAGEFAQQQQMMNIKNTINQLKNLIGLKYDSIERENIENSVPFKLTCLENGFTGIELDDGQILRIEQIVGFYLKSLLEILQKKNQDIKQIVLTVPSSWTEIQRRSILNSASISNIKVACLLDSSIASALSYVKIHGDRFPAEKEKGLNVLFIEFGDSSMNVSVSNLSKKTVEIKSTFSDESLGGQHFTDVLEKFLIEKVTEKYKIDPKTNKRSMIRFKQAVEKVKKNLSSNPVVLFEVPSLMNDIDISMTIKREEFNELIKDEIARIKPNIEKALEKANLSKEQISFVEIIGGSSRIASIKAEIKEIIGSDAKMSLDLDECFAIGAGYMASKIDGNDIGVEIINEKCSNEIVAKNNEDNNVVSVFNDNSLMPSISNIKMEINNKQNLSFICNNSTIGVASIETGVDEKVDAEIEVSIDSFGLINIKDAAYKIIHKEEIKEQNETEEIKEQAEAEETKEPNETEETKEQSVIEEAKEQAETEIKEQNETEETKEQAETENKEQNETEIKEQIETNTIQEETKENDEIKEEKTNKQSIEEPQQKDEAKQEEEKDNLIKCASFSYTPLMTLTQQEISEFQKVEEEQSKQDKLQLEIDNTKNDLESLIFSTENELKSIKINEKEQKDEVHSDIEKMKESIESIHNWFDENEFERLSLDEYKSRINEIIEIKKGITDHHLYESKINQINEIKQKLDSLLEKVTKDEDRIQFEESVSLQSTIPKQIESIEELLKSPKASIISTDLSDIKKELKEVESKFDALQAIPIIKKRRVRRRKNNSNRNQQRQFDRTWSPFGMGGGFFDDFINADPWQQRRNNFYNRQQEPEDEYEYAYEYEENERDKRPLTKNNQRRPSSSQQQNSKQKQLNKEAQKQEYLRRQQQIEQEEQLRRQKAAQIEMENRRRQQQIEQEEQLRRQKAAQIEMENRRRQQIEQEKMRRAKEAEMMRRERSMNDSWGPTSDPWSSPYGYPFGRTANPQRQSARPRQQRRVMPGYGYPWGF